MIYFLARGALRQVLHLLEREQLWADSTCQLNILFPKGPVFFYRIALYRNNLSWEPVLWRCCGPGTGGSIINWPPGSGSRSVIRITDPDSVPDPYYLSKNQQHLRKKCNILYYLMIRHCTDSKKRCRYGLMVMVDRISSKRKLVQILQEKSGNSLMQHGSDYIPAWIHLQDSSHFLVHLTRWL